MEEQDSLFLKLKDFSRINAQFRIAFESFEKNKSLSRLEKNNVHLNYIATQIFNVSQYFETVFSHFSEELPRFLNILVNTNSSDNFDYEKHVYACTVISKIIQKRTDLTSYALKYFENHSSPFNKKNSQNPSKKRKFESTMNVDELDLLIVESTYFILKTNPDHYRNIWNWSDFIKIYKTNTNTKVLWIVCHTLAIVFGLNEKHLKKLINTFMSKEISIQHLCQFNLKSTLSETSAKAGVIDKNPQIYIPKNAFEKVANICGIYLQTVNEFVENDLLLEVKSTKENLRKLALGLTSNKALCLQGPVGSGKTSLVEHLALKTGRKIGENFIKVQLGDQTDSKMLLGTYRCTDVPGEFIWQPGVLTQAVVDGNWLLLEDIDSASMDIASVLTSLLENRCLTVPGYKDSVPVAPNFQLFVTQRLVTTITGHHKKHSNAMTLLEKHLLQINIDPLSVDDLKEILITRYSKFQTITDRLINVFQLFNKETDQNLISIPKSGRLISTRDFFKWCSRAIIDFDVSSQESALKVLQDAIDVFCCSYSNAQEALNLAVEISTNLSIINQKAEYFFKTYKPEMHLTQDSLIAGRASIKRDNNIFTKTAKFSFTRPSAVLLERIMCCVNLKEPVLLVGETGTGKTSSVQFLANTIGQKLVVINMNQQSDSADLLGGYKPVDFKFIVAPVRREFEEIFCDYFKVEPNKKYLSNVAVCFNSQRWSDLVKLMTKSCEAAIKRLPAAMDESKKTDNLEKLNKEENFLKRWQLVAEKLHKLAMQLKQPNSLAFAFIEGSLVKAVEKGYWVLLDEINLANAETLECLSGLLEGSKGSLCLLERGDKQPVKRHSNFTLFACMNPSTDVGKKDLPPGLRNRFTEFYVDELTEKSDLLLLVNNYLEAMSLKDKDLNKIVDFYLKVRKQTIMTLSDGLGHKPHYSLRSLCRSLMIASSNPCGMFKRSLYEAFCLGFLTQLDSASYNIVQKMITTYFLGDDKSAKAIMKQPIPEPKDGETYIKFEDNWVHKGSLEPVPPEDYILTGSVRKNLKDLVRIVSIGKLPVLLQGDTSVGKTSLITYLAKSSGNKCVRINNHEHTDLQEYIGSYVADSSGKLVFREGLLVEAMRKGHWIILDELNLAPTDVLEALNRVLDDNRELFIPETQETVKANPNFMLFATQNPPGAYGGRKMLSRAFRNRFVELHFNEIPADELEFILQKRCQMPPSYAKKMISVMTDLQIRRKGSAAFAGKQGFMTLRDLFRWGERYRLAPKLEKLYDWDQHLADEGYLVLAGRVRRTEERGEITEVLQKHLKRTVSPQQLFTLSDKTSSVTQHVLEKILSDKSKHRNIVWTFNMRQLAVLVAKAIEFKEPVLLVGETGGGKTTVCQLIAENNGQNLLTVNCHMHTESSDFIGGLRPVRDHTEDANKLFEWVDGPLIQAMVKGDVFLADEISLADDSVLERLNSLLEPERSLLLAEKGIDLNNTENSELLIANPGFHFIGTMNPGGDFGKKELSPALRNRFTEIWCESCTDKNDLISIIEQNIKGGISFGNQQDGSSGIGKSIMGFVEWFQGTEIGKRFTISIRDILTWVNFINVCAEKIEISEAYLHGAFLTFLDSLGSGATSTESIKILEKFRFQCESFLIKQLKTLTHVEPTLLEKLSVDITKKSFGIKPFYIQNGKLVSAKENFSFNAPTTIFNTLRLLRGMQLNKAILLEGSPGVGKTSLVTALAKYTGHKIFRINLSDQTDISDLFGADLPIEGGTGGQFSWRDGPLLQALKKGDWVLLDELNLASQSVLEGLNACLDHRGEVFIPELGKTFHITPGTRFFACQNPLKQGGSRRGLPKSFLNRFIQVYVNTLNDRDLKFILENQFNEIPSDVLEKMLKFNSKVTDELESHTFGHKGSPWEYNLRDLTRWCEAVLYVYKINPKPDKQFEPERAVQLIYGDRMRTNFDKLKIRDIFESVFECGFSGNNPVVYVNSDSVYFGDVRVERDTDNLNYNVLKQDKTCLVLRSQLPALRSLAYCVNLKWMAILVGTSGSGKSGVVKTLSNLAGKTLKTLPVTSAMDTTDILGGFEQTDYSRHLDELIRLTEHMLMEIIQDLLISKKIDESLDLINIWEIFKEISVSTKQTMDEEAKLFVRKISKLELVWDKLEKLTNNKLMINNLRTKGDKMASCVKKEGSLNAGGKFEWVDSMLTKCLQDGSWLLIDNVNLCSAAVLDRLNALLEPNGVLTIAERGVDANGQMVHIRPHKDFRLFLTMDPKNGEISRAMRNRGVEICLVNDDSDEKLNMLDLKSMINLNGLNRPEWINVLIKTHNFVSDLILGEKPTINEILQASFLISQQLNHGVVNFADTIIEVYYKTRSSVEFNCTDAVTVITDEVRKYLSQVDEINVDEDIIDFYNENSTLKTEELQSISDIAKVKQQCSLLMSLMDYKDRNSCVTIYKYILANMYSITSCEDLQIRHLYLQNILRNNSEDLQLIDKFNRIVNQFKNSSRLPLDYRWTPDIINKFLQEEKGNNINLSLHLSIQYQIEKLKTLNVNAEIKKSKKLSLNDYIIELRKRNKTEKFDNVDIVQFIELLEEFDACLKQLPEKIQINENNFVEILQLLTWRFLFFQCTLKNMKNISSTDYYSMLANLLMHYKWFFKNSIKRLSEIVKTPLNAKIMEITTTINSNLEKQFSSLNKLSKNYNKHNNRPPPFINDHQLEVVPVFNDISDKYNYFDRRNDLMKVLSILKTDKELYETLVDVKQELNFDFTDVSKQITLLKHLHDNYEENKPESINKFDLEVLPFKDYFNQLETRLNIRTIQEEKTVEPITKTLLTPLELMGLLQRYSSEKDNRYLHEIRRVYNTYIMNSAYIKPSKFLQTEELDISLTNFTPFLTFYFNHFLVNLEGNNFNTNLGNFRELQKQHKMLNGTLWSNIMQLNSENYDFLKSETNYVLVRFKTFIKEFGLSLDVDMDKSPEEILQLCLVLLRKYKNNLKVQQIVYHLENCIKNSKLLGKDNNFNNKLLIISDLFMELNYVQMMFNSNLPLVDPLAKKAIKKKYCLESITFFQDIGKALRLQSDVFSENKDLHSYSQPIKSMIKKLEIKNTDLGKYVAVRSKNVLYESVYKMVHHSFSTILSNEYVLAELKNLNFCINLILQNNSDLDLSKCTKTLNQYESSIISYENLLYEWRNFRSTFPDIMEPLLSDVTEFLYGLKLKINLLKKLIKEYENTKQNVNLQEAMENLVALPSLNEKQNNLERQIDNYTEAKFKNFISAELENVDNNFVLKLEKIRLLKCGIHEAFNNCVIEAKTKHNLDKKSFMKFHTLVNHFVTAWNLEEQDKEEKKKEAESLYKTKTKCDDKPEEEQIEDELRELFPSHHDEDFSDFQKKDLSDDLEEKSQESELLALKEEDLKFVVELHKILVQNFTKSEWLNPSVDKSVTYDFVHPLLEKFKLFKLLLNNSKNCLDYTMDTKLTGSLSVLVSVAQRYGDTSYLGEQSSPLKLLNKHNYDFYKDSNVKEIQSSYHILEELKIRINQLLDEWSEQPTLKSIIVLIDRIYSFDLTSPVSRFLTGFEILLSKCHEWEEVAHSGVSLSQFTPNITQQIITWRKLELSMWKDLLNKTYEKMNAPVAKWWLYMYNIMQQFIVESKFTTEELIDTLQNFIVKSSLAEFHSRLELLYVFQSHVVYLERTSQTQEFINVLWNLYCYYNQFDSAIVTKLKDLRSPIEKKLKDYVKIVRWKDINYWAIKETVEKSHRTLHKYIREYKDVLNQPVCTYLVNSTNNTTENVGIWDRPQRQNPKTYHYTLDVDAYVTKQSLTKKISSTDVTIEEGILSKIDTYFLKSRKLCKDTILSTKYPTLIQNLDSFVTDIIERSTHLQNLEADSTLPKEKQKSQAKNILQQKHRALADLFKTLSKIGLSFKTGIIEAKLKKLSSDFTIKPIDLIANFSNINHGRKEEKILTIWNACEVYYVRCLMRTEILENALRNPAKDLGVQNIERCKGFTSHLLNLSHKQKTDLINTSRMYYYLRFYLKQMNDFCEAKNFVTLNKIETLKNLLKNIIIVANQYKIILNSCPEDAIGDDNVEIPTLKVNTKDFIKEKHDALWTKTSQMLNDIINIVGKLANSLSKLTGHVPSCEYDLVYPQFVCVGETTNTLNELITEISEKLDKLIEVFNGIPLADSLVWLKSELNKIEHDFLQNDITESKDAKSYKNDVEKYTEKMLLAMQGIYKKYKDKEEPPNADDEEDLELTEDLLKGHLVENLSSDFALLEMKRVLKATHKIASILFSNSPEETKELRELVKQSLPILEQILLLYQYFITQEVSAYRVSCKMNSILLNIFIDLAQRGFCVPPELSDEMDSEGMNKPTDGMGLGEGQGERDVSDKIESEDQLDDAQPAGQEKQKEEDKDCKEEDKGIEMSEDFDSKLQDKEKAEDDEESKSDDSDANEQMGETEKGADQLDQEIWGDEEEEANEDEGDEEESQEKEEQGNKGEKEGEDQLGAKEDKPNKPDEQQEQNEEGEEKEKSKKDINEMEEPEYDDEQNDPYHGNQPELPEPEPMDLPDDLQLDDGEEKNDDNQEENPFDIDAMKEDNVPEDKEEEDKTNNEEQQNDEATSFSSDDEDDTEKNGDNDDEFHEEVENENKEDKKEEEAGMNEGEVEKEEENKHEEEEKEDNEESALDQTATNEENVEAMDVDKSESADKTQSTQMENQKSNQPIEELCQEDNPDKDGTGQSQMEESKTGHSAQTSAPQETQSLKREREDNEIKKQKPGESDNQRSLGDTNEPTKKKLKTVEATDDGQDDDQNPEEKDTAEMYQHIKDAKESSTQVLDTATEEQAEAQQKEIPNMEEEEVGEEATESQTELPKDEDKDEDMPEVENAKAEKTDGVKDEKSKKQQHPDGDILNDMKDIDVEGDVVETSTVLRSNETTHHTQFTNLSENTAERLTIEEINALRTDVEKQLSAWNEPPTNLEAEQTWQKISSVTSSLAQDLSEQLRLVLEPTLASRLKGDFRTGRRINMRKVIPYIASQFRKDKIWLRRTKPSKREYQIVLAIDDSSSMADNHSKEIAFESVALISKALTLLESGQLSILSFGENTEIVHKLADQFTEKSGVKLLQKFKFDQNKTCISKLVDFSTEMFNQSQMHSSALNAKLLVIVSDGRGVFSEGETFVRQAVRRAKLSNIFMVFVIIDSPENKNSILDIRMPVFKDGKLLGIQTYMDVFPFSFYIILRDINSLPNVLSDALRQWFEVVSNLDKQ
ncbi:unnamed protein product [Brassicogethes aeneus]|uniref:Midasin n=1 Tax=Brassicogethes aeneus TaxID=1431903 RepID=A0A9P0FHW4_BRAAE|nr:unnamed protein product [Brassicogethes aeneus]